DLLLASQKDMPAIVMTEDSGRIRWWMFKGDFYREKVDGYSEDEIKILLIDQFQRSIKKKQWKVNRANARISQRGSESTIGRQPIPDDVKILVWQRDGGRCVKFSSQEALEFDHIIPLSRGGSN